MKKRQLVSAFLAAVMSLSVLTAVSKAPVTANAADATLPYNAEIVIDNDWRFHLGDVNGAEAIGFSDNDWEEISLPHDYSLTQDYTPDAEAESGYKPGGIGWYRKHLYVGSHLANSRFVLTFDGAYMNTEVYVNGVQAAFHPYGYSMFSVDITDLVIAGKENVIAVKTNNKLPSSRWYSGSGIYRDVFLLVTPKTHIEEDSLTFTTPDLSNRNVRAKSAVTRFRIINEEASDRRVDIRTALYRIDPESGKPSASPVATNGETQTIRAGAAFQIQETVKVTNPALWSPSEPNLYLLRAELYMDGVLAQTLEKEVGFRTFTFNANTGFAVNGVNTKINGVCLHHDQGGLGAAAYADAIERQLTIMKNMGVNAVRVSHNPSSRAMRTLANRLGIMLVEESFDTWLGHRNFNTYDYASIFNERVGTVNERLLHARADETWAEYDIKQMVLAARNDPSVMMYSLGNEVQNITSGDTSNYGRIIQQLGTWVDETDGTRQVTSGNEKLQGNTGDKVAIDMASYLAGKSGLQGVIGLNYASGETYDVMHAKYPKWLFLASEVASAVGTRGTYRTWGESYMIPARDEFHPEYVSWGSSAAQALYWTLKRDFVAGQFVWSGFDYLGEPTPWNSMGSGQAGPTWPSPKSSYFGIVDTAGIPKDSYYLYQSQWNHDVTTLHVLPDFNIMLRDSYWCIDIDVYTNAHAVRLEVLDSRGNVVTDYGIKYMTKKTTPAGHTYYENEGVGRSYSEPEKNLYLSWRVKYIDGGSVRATAYDENGNVITETSGVNERFDIPKGYHFTVRPEKETVKADDHALNYIRITSDTFSGHLVKTAYDTEITVEGPATLVALDNGDPTDHRSYQDNTRELFYGEMTAIVRMTGEPGTVTVRAYSHNNASGSATFEVVANDETKLTEAWLVGDDDPEASEVVPEKEAQNIAPLASSLTNSVPDGLQSDRFASINDGVLISEPNYSGGPNQQAWSNYNNAQAGVRDATVDFGFDRSYEIRDIVLYQFTDSWSAALPESVTFTANGETFDAALLSEEVLSATTVKRHYRLETPVVTDALSITEAAQDGIRHSNIRYCIGFSEIEIYAVEAKDPAPVFRDLPASAILDVLVGSEQPGADSSRYNAIDNNVNTMWHSHWDGCTEAERSITLVLDKEYNVAAYKYLPRTGDGDGDNNGRVADYAIDVSTDGYSYTTVASGHWTEEAVLKEVSFAPVSARYVRLRGITTYGSVGKSNLFMSALEVGLVAEE